ncbi:UrcA family protein [Sphingopyxis sp.]|uniref:UrcA family protein n=1 Tax=Sphingopyxis sp. TaxID=1908224 RepID=UPI003D6D4434
MMTRTLILALSLTVAAVPAAAQTEGATAAVNTNDLDLTHAADRARLDMRLKNAARRVCQSGLRGLAEAARQSACVSATLANAAPQTERAIAQAQSGTQLALLMVNIAR